VSPEQAVRAPAVETFGLERNIVAVSAAVFLLALGENLWKRLAHRSRPLASSELARISSMVSISTRADGSVTGTGVAAHWFYS